MAVREVVVIGGGAIGALSAYHLAKKGNKVTLIEKDRFAGGCSHGNCGYISPSHVLPIAGPGVLWSTFKTLFKRNSPLKVRPGFALKNLGWFLGFARRCNKSSAFEAAPGIHALLHSSRRLFDELLSTEQLNCEFEAQGCFFVFHSEDHFERYHHVAQLFEDQFGLTMERFDHEKLLEREPSLRPEAVAGAYLCHNDAQVRPNIFMKEMKRVLLQLGVTIHENCAFSSFQEEAGKARAILTAKGEFAADHFVLALGAWTGRFHRELGCNIPIIPGKGYSITGEKPENCPKYPMIFEQHRVAVTPFQTGFRIGSTMEFAGYDDRLNRDRLQLLRDGAKLYLKTADFSGAVEEWWGWRPMIYDGKPIVDFTPRYSNVLVAAGHGMLGLSMCPGTGQLVAELINNESPHVDPKPYSLQRF